MTFEEAKEILAVLAEERVDYVLIGSMAMAAQGLPRATHDIDFFVAPNKENIERLKCALQQLYQDPNVDQIDANELIGDYPALQYIPPHGRYSMDILTRLGEAFDFQDIEYEEFILDTVSVRVATPRMLYEMKKNTVRPQDRVDAERIKAAFETGEEKW